MRLVLKGMKGDSEGMEERDAGVGRGYRGMTTAERVKGWRLRREATTADHNDMMQRRNDGGGFMAKVMQSLRVVKVRAGNVADGLREKGQHQKHDAANVV